MQTPYPTTGPPQPWGYYRRDLKTESGLKHLNWGITAYILAAVLSFLVSVIAVYMVLSTDPATLGEALGALAGLVALTCGALILLIFTLIIWLVGLYEMHAGKDEFGPEHSKSVSRAVLLIVLYIVILVLAFIVGFIIGFSSATQQGITVEAARTVLLISTVLGVVSAIVLGLAIVYLILELCDEKYKKILWVGLVVVVITTALGATLTLMTQYEDPLSAAAGDYSSVISGWDFIAFILFLLCYRHVYSRVKEGRIQPSGMAPTGAYAPYSPYAPPAAPSAPSYGPSPAGSCPVCGAYLSGGQRFCYNCGSRLG